LWCARCSEQYNPSPLGCKNNGYVTDSSWGYRLRVSADDSNVFNSHHGHAERLLQDVDGVSMDSAFIEDREVLASSSSRTPRSTRSSSTWSITRMTLRSTV
jgi:hypothetical protein